MATAAGCMKGVDIDTRAAKAGHVGFSSRVELGGTVHATSWQIRARSARSDIAASKPWAALKGAAQDIKSLHLKDQCQDPGRLDAFTREHNGIYMDFTRQNITSETFQLLLDLASSAGLKDKIAAMFGGQHINATEDRAVLHTALRAAADEEAFVDGKNVVPDVHEVLGRIKDFSEQVRSGEWRGATGKKLSDVVAIGIGGSYLGPLFVHTALTYDKDSQEQAEGRKLRFLANVDPVDVATALDGLNPETTLVVVVSKTFTTTETMLNARTVRDWLVSELGEDAVAKHMVAVSSNLKLVEQFGINPKNAFGFWDWVGGRYSVTSAVGVLPLALHFGYEKVEEFLAGARDVDHHFKEAKLEANLPVILGLLSVWNSTFLGRPAIAVLPYSQALAKFPAHIQQVSMESLGKRVAIDGDTLSFEAGEIIFGEPGTNGQHSFYQLIHQGRVIPAELIGSIKSQHAIYLEGEPVSNHDELMCNFFAQADALAIGKGPEQLEAENTPAALVPHKTFPGNRPSTSILLKDVTPFSVGQLLALYENRVAVQGFIWDINAFDQWGVELGKVLATKVRGKINVSRTEKKQVSESDGFNPSTVKLINRYLEG